MITTKEYLALSEFVYLDTAKFGDKDLGDFQTKEDLVRQYLGLSDSEPVTSAHMEQVRPSLLEYWDEGVNYRINKWDSME